MWFDNFYESLLTRAAPVIWFLVPPYYVQLAELHFLEFVRANVITEIKIILAPVTHSGDCVDPRRESWIKVRGHS